MFVTPFLLIAVFYRGNVTVRWSHAGSCVNLQRRLCGMKIEVRILFWKKF